MAQGEIGQPYNVDKEEGNGFKFAFKSSHEPSDSASQFPDPRANQTIGPMSA